MNPFSGGRAFLFLSFAALSAAAQPLATPAEHLRPPEQTYLTFPEWFLVFSPAEYAEFLRKHPPNEFPFMGHTRQFWQGYGAVWAETGDRYPVNIGYHVMVSVIGVSTTVEYGLKSWYEKLVGRLSLLTHGKEMTAEDKLAAEVAQEYVDFIRVDPWYKYDFGKRLGEVWTDTGFWGPHPLRKWERKYALTTEFAAKAIYAWLIGKATKIGYQEPRPVTAVVAANLPEEAILEAGNMEIMRKDPETRSALVLLPRYQAFTTEALSLAKQGVEFAEIAGNRDEILISVIAPVSWSPDNPQNRVVLRQPILTQPGKERYVLSLPIVALAENLRKLMAVHVEIEHIYDF